VNKNNNMEFSMKNTKGKWEVTNQNQKDLILELTRKERIRLHNLRRNIYINILDRSVIVNKEGEDLDSEIAKEIDLCTTVINELKGGK
jgi:hypothetical protein